jgi:dienelactone hydrolase
MRSLALLVLALAAGRLAAATKVDTVDYQVDGTTCSGLLAYDDAWSGQRPAVLVTHDWMGITERTRKNAEDLVKLGYVAFCVDVYGKGVRPADAGEAGKLAGSFKADRPKLRGRMQGALTTLLASGKADAKRIGAIGYCFGGTSALELARAGAPVVATVSFHGGLNTPTPGDARNIAGKVLVLHGADDPFVPAAEVAAFQEEMRAAKVDWQFVAYGNSVHSFTNQSAGSDNSKGQAYNANADRRSWQGMSDFFAEVFAAK